MKDIDALLVALKAQSEAQFPDPDRLLGLIHTLARGRDFSAFGDAHYMALKRHRQEMRDLAKTLMKRYEAHYAKQAERETIEEILKALKAIFDLLPPVEQPVKARRVGFENLTQLLDCVTSRGGFVGELREAIQRPPTRFRNMYPKSPDVHPSLVERNGEYLLGRIAEDTDFPQEVRLKVGTETCLRIGEGLTPRSNWWQLERSVGRLFRAWVDRHGAPFTGLANKISPYGDFAPTPHVLAGVFLGHHIWTGAGYWWLDAEFYGSQRVIRTIHGQHPLYFSVHELSLEAQEQLLSLVQCIYSP